MLAWHGQLQIIARHIKTKLIKSDQTYISIVTYFESQLT